VQCAVAAKAQIKLIPMLLGACVKELRCSLEEPRGRTMEAMYMYCVDLRPERGRKSRCRVQELAVQTSHPFRSTSPQPSGHGHETTSNLCIIYSEHLLRP
jgi:hypothetical protein